MIRYLGLITVVSMLLIRCSSGPAPVAGGTVIPNLIVGNVVYEDSRPAIGKSVTMKSIIINADGDSTLVDTTTETDENGRYELGHIQKGKYVISCDDAASGLSSVISKFERKTDSTVVASNMILKSKVTLIGRVLTEEGISKSNIQVFIPGISGREFTDSNGIYTLPLMPQGHYELAIISGNTINFLPTTIENVTQATVYVKDVKIELQGSNLDDYSFYDHDLDYSYSILPIGYKVGNEPTWYLNKNFTGPKYFAVIDEVLKEYNPKYTMLFVVGSDAVWLSDGNLVSRLEKEMAFSVFVFEHNKVSISDTAGMDIIYMSSSILADTLLAHAMLRDVHQPIVSSEDNYFPYLMISDSTEDKHFGDIKSDSYIKVVNPDHFIASGLSNYVQVLFDEGWMSWGKPVGDVEIIAIFPGSEDDIKALIFCYDRGDAMFDDYIAPARRVGHFFTHTKYTVRNLTEEGWQMFAACVLWALGETGDGIISRK